MPIWIRSTISVSFSGGMGWSCPSGDRSVANPSASGSSPCRWVFRLRCARRCRFAVARFGTVRWVFRLSFLDAGKPLVCGHLLLRD